MAKRTRRPKKKKAPRKTAPDTKPKLPPLPGVEEIAGDLGVSKAAVYLLARRKGAPLHKGGGRGRGYRFESFAAVRAWLDADRAALLAPAILVSARFAREGWAGDACRACERDPAFETLAYVRLGDHVRAFRRRGRVHVFCWCSARIGSVPEKLIPAGDLTLMPGPADGGERKRR